MAQAFESSELHHQILAFQSHDSEDLALHQAPSPASHSVDSLNDPEHDLDSDADVEPLQIRHSFLPPPVIDPEPHVSNQFYTFNSASHNLMALCILQNRYATPDEIRSATPHSVLVSWRGVWKDRNEDTAYLTGWKRIQDKLLAEVDSQGSEVLFFKNNPQQRVPHVDQWQEIVQSFHGDADLKHLGLKETIERIKQAWTVGAKFYGIPESYIRVFVASCPVCCSDTSANHGRSKRRRFEYTDSFEVQAREVPQRLHELAAKHQVVLCIRQKYIRYKPFLAEVKDYCCHRAGEPNTKKPGVLKRKRYTSKRCGCGFRIRAIVPIANYSEKEKTFTYQEEGQAIFKLFAVHSGHKPGPHEGSARIIHRFLGPAGLAIDSIPQFDSEEGEDLSVALKDETEARDSVRQQVQELRMELTQLEEKLASLSQDSLNTVCHDLAAMTQRLRKVDELNKPSGMSITKSQADAALINEPGIGDWDDGQNKDKDDSELICSSDNRFCPATEPGHQWQRPGLGQPPKRKVSRDSYAKWVDTVKESCTPCDAKSILADEGPNRCAADDRQGGAVSVGGDGSLVAMPVDNYYQENAKWYEGMSCSLDPTADCGDGLSETVESRFTHTIV